jgi:Uma2 family endonuclease
MTTQPRPARLTADAFIAWAMEQPQGRFELAGGEVVAMAPERAVHFRTKGRAYRAFGDAIAKAGLGCEAFPDGATVRIDDLTVYEPDALVRCGTPVPDDAIEVPDPLIVVEVVSPSSRGIDTGVKLAAYFRLASVMHYLVVDTETRVVVHHRREAEDAIATRIVHAGRLELDPPGLAVEIEAIFPAA